jgi:hypothetical protein
VGGWPYVTWPYVTRPYVTVTLVGVLLIILFPQIALFLPGYFFSKHG